MTPPPRHPQLASAVLMVRPEQFRGNEQTARDNAYQRIQPTEVARPAALREFDEAAETLQRAGVEVLVLAGGAPAGADLPDAVFPNNWVATFADGALFTFPMTHPNRRAETGQLPAVEALLAERGFQITHHLRLGRDGEDRDFLEGTGSVVVNHEEGIVFASLSPRTHLGMVHRFARLRGISEVHTFRALGKMGEEVYHTNVLMSIGKGFSVFCPDAVPNEEERKRVLSRLQACGEVLILDRSQMNDSFCANVLGVQSRQGEQVVVMSQTAWDGFTPSHRRILKKHGHPALLSIPTIEAVGGGSARCMVAEIFLPREG